MAYVCLEAEECRVFIKNGKLRFQARETDMDGNVVEQVTVSFPKEMARYFNLVENLDETGCACRHDQPPQNRIEGYLTGGDS